jgi:hypothetical protein
MVSVVESGYHNISTTKNMRITFEWYLQDEKCVETLTVFHCENLSASLLPVNKLVSVKKVIHKNL